MQEKAEYGHGDIRLPSASAAHLKMIIYAQRAVAGDVLDDAT